MKKIILIMCMLVFTGSAFAKQYNNDTYEKEQTYREYSQQETKTTSQDKINKTEKNVQRQVKFGSNKSGSPSSYYNFGGTSGYKGKF